MTYSTQREILDEFKKCPDNPMGEKKLRTFLHNKLRSHAGKRVDFLFDRGDHPTLPRYFMLCYDLSKLRRKP